MWSHKSRVNVPSWIQIEQKIKELTNYIWSGIRFERYIAVDSQRSKDISMFYFKIYVYIKDTTAFKQKISNIFHIKWRWSEWENKNFIDTFSLDNWQSNER